MLGSGWGGVKAPWLVPPCYSSVGEWTLPHLLLGGNRLRIDPHVPLASAACGLCSRQVIPTPWPRLFHSIRLSSQGQMKVGSVGVGVWTS